MGFNEDTLLFLANYCFTHRKKSLEDMDITVKNLYEKGLVNKGRAVHVLDPQKPFTGTAVGINDHGELLVEPDDGGPVRAVGTGEVSVRGVAGYV